jgi:hypothetical protein
MADERRNACAAAAAGGHAVAAVACLVIAMGCSLIKKKDGGDGVTIVPHGAASIAGRYRAGLSLRQRMLDGNGLML